jgi:hypothetical protein
MRKEFGQRVGDGDIHSNNAHRCSHSYIPNHRSYQHCTFPQTPIEDPTKALFRLRADNKACRLPGRQVTNRPRTNGGPRRTQRRPTRVSPRTARPPRPPAPPSTPGGAAAAIASPHRHADRSPHLMTTRRAHPAGHRFRSSSGPAQRRNCLGAKRSRHRMATATSEADDPRPYFARLLQHWHPRRLSHARDERNDSRWEPATGPGDVGPCRAM